MERELWNAIQYPLIGCVYFYVNAIIGVGLLLIKVKMERELWKAIQYPLIGCVYFYVNAIIGVGLLLIKIKVWMDPLAVILLLVFGAVYPVPEPSLRVLGIVIPIYVWHRKMELGKQHSDSEKVDFEMERELCNAIQYSLIGCVYFYVDAIIGVGILLIKINGRMDSSLDLILFSVLRYVYLYPEPSVQALGIVIFTSFWHKKVELQKQHSDSEIVSKTSDAPPSKNTSEARTTGLNGTNKTPINCSDSDSERVSKTYDAPPSKKTSDARTTGLNGTNKTPINCSDSDSERVSKTYDAPPSKKASDARTTGLNGTNKTPINCSDSDSERVSKTYDAPPSKKASDAHTTGLNGTNKTAINSSDSHSETTNGIPIDSTDSDSEIVSRTTESNKIERFPINLIREATKSFSDVIGYGGFGDVYKGELKKWGNVAVKRCKAQGNDKTNARLQFRREIELLSKLNHCNVVPLIGYCEEGGEMLLVYKYMEGGTLRSRLDDSSKPPLTWAERLNISLGMARGLCYLHTGSKEGIIHRDIKSANILLDGNLVAKICDFGLSKIGFEERNLNSDLKGTPGYIDPQYFQNHLLTQKSDVFALGVVLLEVLCGKKAVFEDESKQVSLVKWAKQFMEKGRLKEIVDIKIAGTIPRHSLTKFGEIVKKCLADDIDERPSMEDIVSGLKHILNHPHKPPTLVETVCNKLLKVIIGKCKRVLAIWHQQI